MATNEPPALYAVEYAGLVLQRLRELAKDASARGDGPSFAAAVKEFQRRLALYPQFGDPLYDLKAEPGQIYNGIIRPLLMRYAVYEERRLVVCGGPPMLLPMARPDAPAEQ